MKLKPSINNALCQQVSVELENSQKYQVLGSYFDDLQLTHIANLFYEEAKGEQGHANMIIKYINDRTDGKYVPVDIETPNLNITSIQEAGRIYLETEIETTNALEAIADLICEEKSYLDFVFIQKMLDMQIEEEKDANELMLQLSKVSDVVIYDKVCKKV